MNAYHPDYHEGWRDAYYNRGTDKVREKLSADYAQGVDHGHRDRCLSLGRSTVPLPKCGCGIPMVEHTMDPCKLDWQQNGGVY